MNRVALRFACSIRKLDEIYRKAVFTPDEVDREILLSFLVIKLHDQWNFRSRQIVLESFGKAEGTMTEYLRTHWSNRKPMDIGWEPDWHIPTNAIRAATLLGVPGVVRITNALGAVTVIEDIRWTRNAIAHNIPTSFSKYHSKITRRRSLGALMPYRLPTETNPASGRSFYEDWCDELYNAISIAI